MSPRFPASFLVASAVGVRCRIDTPCVPGAAAIEGIEVRRPEGYEPNYAYPLLVWFHDAGDDERSIHRVLPAVSDRNLIGLALRGERRQGGGFDWRTNPSAGRAGAERVAKTVRDLRRQCNVHTERVVLAGSGTGADAAARTFFARPEWFGGLAAFGPSTASVPPVSGPSPATAEKPVLLGLASDADRRELLARLGSAGLSVTSRQGAAPGREALRHLDRWLLAAVCGVL